MSPASESPRRVALVGDLGVGFVREVFRGVSMFTRQHALPWVVPPVQLHRSDLLREEVGMADAVIGVATGGLVALVAERPGLPLVNISGYCVGQARISVITDHEAIGRMAARHLLEKGHRTFVTLRFPRRRALDARAEAFQRTVEAEGFPCHPLDLDLSRARACVAALTRQFHDLPRPAGLYCRTDSVAFQLLPILDQAGLRVPQDVAVVGTDNDEMLCETTQPPLSSIELGVERIGRRAAEIVREWLGGRPPAERVETMPPLTVIERGSTRLWVVKDALVARALDRIEAAPPGRVDPIALAAELDVVRRTLDRRFKKALGRTPAQEIRRRQIARACQLLLETDWPVTRIALACGMDHPEHLSRFLRTQTGETPSQYRRRHRLA